MVCSLQIVFYNAKNISVDYKNLLVKTLDSIKETTIFD
jgi:hypothetical protein